MIVRIVTTANSMLFILSLLGSCIGPASTSSSSSLFYHESFDNFMERYSKSYRNKEEERFRRGVYESNLERIVIHNSIHRQSHTHHRLGTNQFMDLEEHEIPRGYDKSLRRNQQTKQATGEGATAFLDEHRQLELGSLKEKWEEETQLPFELDPVEDLPSSVDWRFAATAVKDQGRCGSCWAFASIAALESHLFLKTNQLWDLSVQELVSCTPNPRQCGGKGGCIGATSVQAYDYIVDNGIVSEWYFGYASYTGNNEVNCTLIPSDKTNYAKGAVASMDDYIILPQNNYTVMMNAIAKLGPIVISVAAAGWQFYASGVFAHNFTAPYDADLNHAVVLYGYGTDQESGQDYWLVRNSWSPRWGEGGYIRLLREDDGMCAMDVTPGDGDACKVDDHGNPIDPLPAEKICGTSGVYTTGYVPVGVKSL